MYFSNAAAEFVFKSSFCLLVRVAVLLICFCQFSSISWHRKLCQLSLCLKKGGIRNPKMEFPKNRNYVQLHSSEHGKGDYGPESWVAKVDPLSHANVSVKPPEIAFSEVKPVLNYSIQTGEEFALEFMRDRVNPWKPSGTNILGDSSNATDNMAAVKGIKGVNHTGSDSGSEMVAPSQKSAKELELQISASLGHKVKHGYHSMQSVPQASSGYTSRQSLVCTSSEGSGSSLTKLKFLCSFGGRILPRPSDGKLRYVGGETRIIRINRDITWKELWQKATAIFDETCTIKYQLPGEDLDALVSISSDEDLVNMMEECNVLEDGEGSKKLRMFLFSPGDLDDAQFTLTNPVGDSEIKYVVAVNGMDAGSRKGSMAYGFHSASAIDLNELNALNPNKDSGDTSSEFVGDRKADLSGLVLPTMEIEPTKPIAPSVSKAFEFGEHARPDEEKKHSSEFDYLFDPPNYMAPENDAPQSSHTYAPEQRGLEGQSATGSSTLRFKEQDAKVKPKVDGLILQEGESKQITNEHLMPSPLHSDNLKASPPVEEPLVSVPKLDRESSSKSLKDNVEPDEPMQTTKPLDELPTSSDNEYSASASTHAPESIDSKSDPVDFSYNEPPVPSQRVFRSEWFPREQAELNRISKSDDSLGSQFLVNQAHTNVSQQDLMATSAENSQKGHENIPNEQLVSTGKPFPLEPEFIDDGLTRAQVQKQEPLEGRDSLCESQVLNADIEHGLKFTAEKNDESVKQSQDPIHLVEVPSTRSNTSGVPTWIATPEGTGFSVPRKEQGDILIDINDRFPPELLSDIFSKAILSDSSSGFGPPPKDAPGISVNIENHDPKHWSFFQRLAGNEFARRDVSLIDQDHVVFSSGLTKGEEEAPLAYDFVSHGGVQETYGEDDRTEADGVGVGSTAVNYASSQVKLSEALRYDGLMDHTRVGYSGYEEDIRKIGLPPLDPSLMNFDINSLQIIKNADLEELRELGSGTFGTVYHGKWRGSDVAIKRIKKSCFTGRQSEQERLTVEFWREAEILSKLHHPNIVAFYGVVQDGPGGTLATVTEFMVDGSLRHVLLRKDRHLDRRKRLIIAMDAAFGMEYLHSKNIVHFDLKCDNLLVNLKDSSRPICKVGDFGLSKIKRNTLVSGGVRGTLPWMAPELLNGSSNKVSEKVDVFSFGIVLWEILTGEEPYANMHYGAIIGGIVNNTLRPAIPSHCDPEWRRLMEQCWAPNPTKRPSFTEIASRLRVMSASAQTKKAAATRRSNKLIRP
ncbi:uncharacterized protein LOC127254131 isoform X2 [Andrographis paniculata]|uniref:uncharacterized protein LOC127254131 isoform X2 n=1 Tax=Andrographis paniculata TaxID=175694 RepID=UPI0021E87AA6|nr:uncharacterized protein LOC127254131 isoform X2 [Andrographis paniculata]